MMNDVTPPPTRRIPPEVPQIIDKPVPVHREVPQLQSHTYSTEYPLNHFQAQRRHLYSPAVAAGAAAASRRGGGGGRRRRDGPSTSSQPQQALPPPQHPSMRALEQRIDSLEKHAGLDPTTRASAASAAVSQPARSQQATTSQQWWQDEDDDEDAAADAPDAAASSSHPIAAPDTILPGESALESAPSTYYYHVPTQQEVADSIEESRRLALGRVDRFFAPWPESRPPGWRAVHGPHGPAPWQ